jgi:TetR/AcrR family transcriptional regulator
MKPLTNPSHPQRETRHRNSAETRGAILDAAERIFADAGLAGARIDAIAAAAGVNKAMLYYYFKSKDGLYRAVLKANVEEFHRRAEEVLAGEGSAGSIVLRYVNNHFNFIGARPYYARLFQRLIMAGDRSVDRIIKAHFVPLSRRLIGLIERGVRTGEFRSLDPRHTAISLVALTVFYFNAAPMVRKIGNVDVFDPAEQAQRKSEVLKFIRFALFSNPEAVES